MEALSWASFILQVLIMALILYIDHDRPEPERHPTCRSCRHCEPIPAEYQQFFTPAERMCANGRGWNIQCIDSDRDAISVVMVYDYCSKYIPKGDSYGQTRD